MAIAIYDRVQLQIFAADYDSDDYEARVVDRGDEMILEIPEQKETALITIRGKRIEHYYAGRDEAPGGPDGWELIARWSKLGDIYVGIWIADGSESLFSFRLPKKPTRTG